MFWMKIICTFLLVVSSCVLVECRTYNTGLIFYNLENHNTYLPPTISVSRGRGLAKFKYSSRGSIWSTFGKPCNCMGALCGCCVGIKVKQYNFDQKMCANVSYALPKDEIQLEVFLNDTATAKYGISARNPSPLCVPIMMGIPMSMCIQMSNIGVQGDNLNMCMDFLVRLASTELFEMHFQCMKVGLQGASWVGADGQPVIPANDGKLKDIGSNESEEYYDESEMEEENEVISKEKNKDNIVMNMQEEDLNKAEEELDYNDITEKIMDIVKEQEREEGEEPAKENAELLKENEVEGVSPLKDNTNIEEIVTDIMNSINKGNAAEEIDKLIKTQDKMEANGSEIDNIQSIQESSELSKLGNPETNSIAMEAAESNIENMETYLETIDFEKIKQIEKDFENEEENKEHKKESIELSTEPVKNETQSLKHDINNLKESAISETELGESNEIEEEGQEIENLSNFSIKDVLHLEDLFANAEEKETQVENNTKQTQDLYKESSDMLFTAGNNYDITQESDNSDKEPVILIKEEPVTERLSEDHDLTNTEKLDMLIDVDDSLKTTELNKNVNDLNYSLEMIQQSMDTTTEPLMSAYLKPTMPQIAETTSEIGNIDSIDNSLTTTTIMTKTTTTVTKASKPTIPEEIPTVAVSFIENADDVDKNAHKDNDDAGEEVDDEEDNETDDGDNSLENDSDDYDDEESEENEDETTEKIIKSNDATTTTIFMATTFQLNKEKSDSSQKESSANASKSNESTSNEEINENKTNDEFETMQDEFENNAEEKDEEESNQEHENDAVDKEDEEEAEYEEDEDYEETTTVAVSSTQIKNVNDTCCKTVTSTLALNDFQSTTNNQHDDNSNNKQIPQIETASSNNFHFVSNSNSMISNADINVSNVKTTTNPMLQVITTPSVAAVLTATGSTTKSNVMPLPLARKLFALHHQQQSQLQTQQKQKQLRYHQQLHRISRQRQHYV